MTNRKNFGTFVPLNQKNFIMKLLDAMRTKDSLTENGMVTNSTSLNMCVDLFFQIGAMRGQNKNRLINVFVKAFSENALTAMKLLFWARDIRGGAGERQIFKDIMSYLAVNRTESMRKNLHLVSEFGRWDDLLVLFDTPLENDALELIAKGLKDKNGLAAKWMPRPNNKNVEVKKQANKIRQFLGLTPKDYRKLLVENSNTVEQLMCAKQWSAIDYSKLPSKAMSDLMKAFSKNDKDRFSAYITSLEKGEEGVKINAGALYPYDIVKNVRNGNARGADAQWLALPNFLEGSAERFIPIVDTSGSMFWPESQVSGDLYAGHIAQSLGLYIAERNEGPFKDAFITFNTVPELVVVKGSLSERLNQVNSLRVSGNTNLQNVYELLLSQAKKHNVPESEMPTMLIIFSDMEFNSGVRGYNNNTAQEMLEKMYTEAGYTIPKVVYWNLASRNDKNKPVKFDKNGTALVSGFSPSLLSSLLGGKDMSPYSMMMTVIDSPRYSLVTV
mgnify:CR=1 FL=1